MVETEGGAIMTSASQLIPLLVSGYEEKCFELGIIQRQRGIKTPADLMMLNLFHLINGCSLVEISEVGRLLKIGKFSDVAFMKKFAKCTGWFQWISEQLAPCIVADYQKPVYLQDYRTIAFDATDAVEKGRSGRVYHLHYGIDIFKICSVYHTITEEDVGEKLSNFALRKGDLAIADRAYGTIGGIAHCIDNGADYILRLRTTCFRIYNNEGEKIDLISRFQSLDCEECGEVAGFIHLIDGRTVPVRVCVKRKSKEAFENSKKKLRRRESKNGNKLSDATLKFNEFIVLATSLPDSIPAVDVLETYRYRWQIEMYFKRLKSILGFGELPKKQVDSSLAWLNGKLMVALLVELFLAKSVFPPAIKGQPKYLERDQADCPCSQDGNYLS